MKNFALCVSGLLLLLTSSIFASTSGTTFAVGTCRPNLPSFPTISAAVAGVPAGSTIQICPGTYSENVSINQPLTLQGISSADAALVVINPAGLAVPAVSVGGTGPVSISGIQVACPFGCVNGIEYDNASGTLNFISVIGATASVSVSDGSSQTLTIKSSSFSGGSAIQTIVPSGTLALTVQGSVFAGGGGMVLESGTAATISGNFFDGTGGGGTAITSSGGSTILGNTIVNYFSSIHSTAGDTLTGNKLFDNATAIAATGVGTFQNNTIMNSTVGIDLGCTASVATFNTFVNTATGFDHVPTSFGAVKNAFFSVPVIKGTICP